MPALDQDDDTLEIENSEPPAKRIFLLIAGLFCIVAPTWDLRHAFFDIGWWTVFFGIILAGAYAVGLAFIIGALAGEGLGWTFRDGVLMLRRSSPLRKTRTEVIRGADVARTEIRCITWDSAADTHSVVLHLRTGERLQTPDYRSVAKAEALEADIRRRLGLPDNTR